VFWRTVVQILSTRPRNIEAMLEMMALYLHFRKQTRFVLAGLEQKVLRLRAEDPEAPVDVAAAS
jgi:hypothetical protein